MFFFLDRKSVGKVGYLFYVAASFIADTELVYCCNLLIFVEYVRDECVDFFFNRDSCTNFNFIKRVNHTMLSNSFLRISLAYPSRVSPQLFDVSNPPFNSSTLHEYFSTFRSGMNVVFVQLVYKYWKQCCYCYFNCNHTSKKKFFSCQTLKLKFNLFRFSFRNSIKFTFPHFSLCANIALN